MDTEGMVFVIFVVFCFTAFGAALGFASWDETRRVKALAKSTSAEKSLADVAAK